MKTKEQISNWIKAYLAELLEVAPEQVNEDFEFERFGLNSSAAVSLVGDLEEWLGVELSPSIFFEFNTIAQVSQHLSEQFQNENWVTLEQVGSV